VLPLSTRETAKVAMFRGGFPEVLARPSLRPLWFQSYLQTYLERDVRAISSIRDLSTFRRFLALLASRCGQILNKTDLAAPLGVSVHAIGEWLSILEVTGQTLLVPPFFENFGMRLIKSPRVYFVDSGLVCHLLGIESEMALRTSPFLGAIWETFVASEIVKQQLNSGRAKELYCFRDQQGLEVDFLVPRGNGRLALVECKAGRTVMPGDGGPITRLKDSAERYSAEGFIVYQPVSAREVTTALLPGVKAVGLPELLLALAKR
jgi:predicted AAA+ superfamily ATPase